MKSFSHNEINNKLIDLIMHFPVPYIDILQEQITMCEIDYAWYSDCYIMRFSIKGKTRQLPMWLPVLFQGCHFLKEGGPLACQLYVEGGYIVQFEVVDMGMNEIDWEYLWSNEPVFEIEYNFPTICNYLKTEDLSLSKMRIVQQNVFFDAKTSVGSRILCLGECSISALNTLNNEQLNPEKICYLKNNNQRYFVVFDNNQFEIECSLICLQEVTF